MGDEILGVALFTLFWIAWLTIYLGVPDMQGLQIIITISVIAGHLGGATSGRTP